MPILTVEIVGNPREFGADLAQRLADGTGEVLQSRHQSTWVKLSFIAPAQYAENGASPDRTPQPVFVSILQAIPPNRDALRDQVQSLTRTVAAIVDRPVEYVHIVNEAAGRGRIAFGGSIVE